MDSGKTNRHLSPVPPQAPQPEPQMPYTEQEMDTAMGHVLKRLKPLAARTGWTMEELIEADLFGLLALAYVAALRKNPPAEQIDALAFSYYVRMLAQAPEGFDEVTDLLVLDSFKMCGAPDRSHAASLHLVQD
ncbi:hypothetical protein [Streptomyces lutosisoli]|uniref:Uncharacterized protein n=1 Tax=Streptomyces lutosisoli TaxID=2665721 RepID=A0ABW2VXA9_9ACTN